MDRRGGGRQKHSSSSQGRETWENELAGCSRTPAGLCARLLQGDSAEMRRQKNDTLSPHHVSHGSIGPPATDWKTRLPERPPPTPRSTPTTACVRQGKVPAADRPLCSLCRIQFAVNVIRSVRRGHMVRVITKTKCIISWLLKTWPHTGLWTDCHLPITTPIR